MSSSRLDKIKHSVASVEGEESLYEHTKQKSYGGVGVAAAPVESNYSKSMSGAGIAKNAWVVALVLLAVFVLIVFMILIVWAPKCLVRRKKGDGSSYNKEDLCKRTGRRSNLDYGRTFAWALFVSAVAVLLFLILSAATAAMAGAIWGSAKSGKKSIY